MKNRVYIDTNVFLRFLIKDKTNPNLSLKSKAIFTLLKDKKITLQTNVLVVAEIVYVLEKYYELSKDRVRELLLPLLSLSYLLIKDKEAILSALNLFAEKNVDYEDAYTYFDMANEDISDILTFDDKHFKRLDDIKVITSL
jgi:predicted nucleic-acid-binding protein